MKKVAGKVAFISGGSSGIGLGIAQAFAEAGMKVAIGYRTESHAEQALTQLSGTTNCVHALRVEVADRESMEAAAAEVVRLFGKVHVLVNNAGVQNTSTLSGMSHADWNYLMQVNVGGVFNGIQAFLPRIREHGEGGHVVTTASMVGLFTAGGTYAAYCASKFAAVAMMESLRAELSGSNIGVSVLCPGPVRSNLEEFLKEFDLASDPRDIGQLVLRGMCRNDLYILTHPEFNSIIQYRNDTIMASTPKDAHQRDDRDKRRSDERSALVQSVLERSIYFLDRNRHQSDDLQS